MLGDGDADVAISHAPDAEAKALATHPRWWYRKIMYNDFVLVGPLDDPSKVRGAASLEDALRRIASDRRLSFRAPMRQVPTSASRRCGSWPAPSRRYPNYSGAQIDGISQKATAREEADVRWTLTYPQWRTVAALRDPVAARKRQGAHRILRVGPRTPCA